MNGKELHFLKSCRLIVTGLPRFSYGGVPMTDRDDRVYRDALLLWILHIRDNLGAELPLRQAKSWLLYISTQDADFVADAFKAIDQALLRSESFSEFHAHTREWGLLKAPFNSTISWFFDPCNIGIEGSRTLARLHSCFNFISRVTLRDHPTADETAMEKYQSTMDRIEGVHTQPTRFMREWVAKALPSSPWPMYLPKNGTGSVSELAKTGKKFRPLSMKEKVLITNTPAVQYAAAKSGIPMLPGPRLTSTNRCARVMFVPKGMNNRRVVSPEPTSLMFLQQGIATGIRFHELPAFKHHVDLRKASLNTELARVGSITREFDTIDLSSASDSVRWDFVRSLFSLSPQWQRALKLARSTHRKLPSGEVVVNHFFAPMGSALCFPVEVIVFCAIVEQAMHVLGVKKPYRVYGDDIICHHSVTSVVLAYLKCFGFEPNEDKSFVGDNPFRESCGGEFFNGEDVTPLRLSRSFGGLHSRVPEHIVGLVDLANRAYGRSPLVRWEIVSRLKDVKPILYVPVNSSEFGIWSNSPTNYHLDSCAANEDWFYPRVQAVRLVQEKEPYDELFDEYRYWYWFRSKELSRKDIPVEPQLSGDRFSQLRDQKLRKRPTDIFWQEMP